MSSTQKSRQQKELPKSKSSKNIPPDPDAEEAEGKVQQVMDLLGPMLDFHQSLEAAAEDDLRIHWDVRIVRGKDTPFTHVTGSSSLPKMLAYNMIANAPTRIQQEVVEKILEPLLALMQTKAEQHTFEGLERRNKADGIEEETSPPRCHLSLAQHDRGASGCQNGCQFCTNNANWGEPGTPFANFAFNSIRAYNPLKQRFSKYLQVVGAARFELTTSCSQNGQSIEPQ